MPCMRDNYVFSDRQENDRGYSNGNSNSNVSGNVNGNGGCCSQHSNAKKILLECGHNSQDAIFEMDFEREFTRSGGDGRGRREQTFTLDHVIVDAACLSRPMVKIEFSSLVYFKGEAEHHGGGGGGVTAGESNPVGSDEVVSRSSSSHKNLKVDLLFKLVKICKDTGESVVQSWRYLKDYEIENNDELEIKMSEPFTVTYCDRICSNCCEYKMIVTLEDIDGEIDELRVTKPDLSAIVQG